MIAVAVISVAAVAALLAVVVLQLRAYRELQAQCAAERSELLNRIQAPERIPVPAATEFVVPERETDEWASAGQITFDPEYGLSDDG